MDFLKGLMFLILSLIAGFAVFSIFDFRLAVLFVFLWIDKTVISAFGAVRYFGVELTTVISIIMAMLYGPWFAFFFLLLLIPFLHGLKYVLLPLPPPEWPLFIPSPYNIVDALGGLVAGFIPFSFMARLFLTAVSKDVFYALAERFMMSKPVDVISAITSVVFNMLVGYPFGLFVMSLVSVAV